MCNHWKVNTLPHALPPNCHALLLSSSVIVVVRYRQPPFAIVNQSKLTVKCLVTSSSAPIWWNHTGMSCERAESHLPATARFLLLQTLTRVMLCLIPFSSSPSSSPTSSPPVVEVDRSSSLFFFFLLSSLSLSLSFFSLFPSLSPFYRSLSPPDLFLLFFFITKAGRSPFLARTPPSSVGVRLCLFSFPIWFRELLYFLFFLPKMASF